MIEKQKKRILSRHWNPVVCPGCGKEILPDDNLDNVEYARTKRKTDVFFHTKCIGKVWS